ncbi:O-acetyl-ADP-ribose deacetylase MACROD2 [Triplophysa rosa]|uniref:O-acetyl-ADP-ribose deacetylase MACROD2 n=1 Tax=Triplophysa rosa TaxID=992332 RepID=A0A9W7WP76_TRIRA|nr:O-acetyl-ADP-ribose deacetylase MACROD2 [Triplophysa rosa]
MSKKKKEWRAEKDRLLSLSTEDRRKDYRGNYLALDKIPTWASQENSTVTEDEELKSFSLADKVSLYKGDITILEVDAIVNAGEPGQFEDFKDLSLHRDEVLFKSLA